MSKVPLAPFITEKSNSGNSFLFKIAIGMDVAELVNKIELRVPSALLRRRDLLYTPAIRSIIIRACRLFNAACRRVDIVLFNKSVTRLKRVTSNDFFTHQS